MTTITITVVCVCLNGQTYKPDPKSNELAYDIHFWIGSQSSQVTVMPLRAPHKFPVMLRLRYENLVMLNFPGNDNAM